MPSLAQTLAANPLIRLVADEAKKRTQPVYLVGGAIRDAALGKPPSLDVDVAVAGAPKPFADKIAKRLNAACFVLHDSTQIYRVAVKGPAGVAQIDVARIQGQGIEADLTRRDFSINAMAYKLPFDAEEPFDPYDGLEDIKSRTIRATAAKVFSEDPIRLLRAYRFAAVFEFRI